MNNDLEERDRRYILKIKLIKEDFTSINNTSASISQIPRRHRIRLYVPAFFLERTMRYIHTPGWSSHTYTYLLTTLIYLGDKDHKPLIEILFKRNVYTCSLFLTVCKKIPY